jgi:hypothetical protein
MNKSIFGSLPVRANESQRNKPSTWLNSLLMASLALVLQFHNPNSANASEITKKKTEQAPVVVDAAYLAKAVARINTLVDDNLKKQNLKPNENISDALYVRRVYISLVGRIPMQQEAIAFLNDKSKDRESRLVDQFL